MVVVRSQKVVSVTKVGMDGRRLWGEGAYQLKIALNVRRFLIFVVPSCVLLLSVHRVLGQAPLSGAKYSLLREKGAEGCPVDGCAL